MNLTSKQANAILTRLHWNGFLLERWENAYLKQLVKENGLTVTQAADLLESLFEMERPESSESQNGAIQHVKIAIHRLYQKDARPTCSRCKNKATIYNEMDEGLICKDCQDSLTKN